MKKWLILFLVVPWLCLGEVNFIHEADYISIADHADLTFTADAWAIAFWFKHDGNSSEQFCRIITWGVPAAQPSFMIYIDTGDDGMGWWLANSASSFRRHIDVLKPVATNTWYHLLIQTDGTSYTEMWINGVKQSSSQTHPALETNVANTFYIATDHDQSGNMGCNITELAKWEAELTQIEIDQLYNSKIKGMPRQIQPSSLTYYLPLDDVDSGTSIAGKTFKDLIGSNDGTGVDADGNSKSVGETFLSYPCPIFFPSSPTAAAPAAAAQVIMVSCT